MEKKYYKQKLKLLTRLININTILDDMLLTDNYRLTNLHNLKITALNSILLEETIQNEFTELFKELHNDDYQSYIEGTIDDQIEIYMRNERTLNEEFRYELLNYNIKQEMEKLQEYNPFAYQHIHEIALLSLYHASNYKTNNLDNIKEVKIEDTIKITKEFLKSIDKTGNLYDLFQEKIEDGSIILWNAFDEHKQLSVIKEHKALVMASKEWKNFNEGNKVYLNAPYENTILDIPRLVHEFIHLYIFNSKEKVLDVTPTETFFEEFPSIYYETRLCSHLEQIGFSNEDIQVILEQRQTSFFIDTNELMTLSNLIKIKQQNRNITSNDIINMNKPLFQNLKSTIRFLDEDGIKQYYNEIKKFGIIVDSEEETANNTCDRLNRNIIFLEYREHKRINYIIAKILTDQILEKTKEDNTLPDKVLFITKTLGTTNLEPSEVLELLNCDDLFRQGSKEREKSPKVKEL